MLFFFAPSFKLLEFCDKKQLCLPHTAAFHRKTLAVLFRQHFFVNPHIHTTGPLKIFNPFPNMSIEVPKTKDHFTRVS